MAAGYRTLMRTSAIAELDLFERSWRHRLANRGLDIHTSWDTANDNPNRWTYTISITQEHADNSTANLFSHTECYMGFPSKELALKLELLAG